LGGEEAEESIEERGFARKVIESELCPLRKHRIKIRRGSSIEDFQAIKSLHHTQYFRNVKFLVRTRPIEGQRKRSGEANIVDRMLRLFEDVFDAVGAEFAGDLRLVQRHPTTCLFEDTRNINREGRRSVSYAIGEYLCRS